MFKTKSVMMGFVLAAVCGSSVMAQEAATVPKVLTVIREFVKPGKAGTAHDRTESAFVQAMARAKEPTHYIALTSLSGKSRALYLIPYDSFAAWQADMDSMSKKPALAAELDRVTAADSALLESTDQFAFSYQDDMSLNPRGDLSHARYMEVTSFHVRPGHFAEWQDLVKMVIAAHKKAGTNAHWAMYELEYGGGDNYTLFSSDSSMADIDEGFAEGKKFRDAMGEDGMKKMASMVADCIESTDSELFAINPKQSYPPDEWVKENPDFWKPKMAAPAAKPAMDEKKTKP